MKTTTIQNCQSADWPKGGHESPSCWSVLALVLWTSCLTVGWLGLANPYSRPRAEGRQPEPVQAEILSVELTHDPAPPAVVAPPPPEPAQPPPLLDPVILPPPPPMIAVAQPSPAIAFALPVEGPLQIVEAKQAAYVQPPAQARVDPAAAPQVQRLIHGEGEGRQPLPDYPPQALRAGQEGKVVIRASVNKDGRVIAVEAAEPSPWRLLNAAALRVVRERWRFAPGQIRLYEVSIRFEIKK